MKIHIDEVMDFVACSVLHKFKSVDQLDPPQPKKGRPTKNSIIELYDQALHKTIMYLFNSVQDGFFPSLNLIAKRWGYLWVKPRADQEDLRFKQTSWRDTHEIKRVQGWKKLQEVYAHYKEHTGSPIMVNYPYEVSIGSHTLVGEIDLVRVEKNKEGRERIVMTEFITDEKTAPFLHTRRDWRVTASSYAFRKIMQLNEEKIVYHGVISGKLTETKRDEQDFLQLEHLLNSIDYIRSNDIFYPVFNERCLTCPYQKYCEKGWFDVKN